MDITESLLDIVAHNDDDKVPYVCRKPYDDGPFTTYPLRCYPPRPHFLENEGLFSHELETPTPVSDLEDFLQTWLFFGLLKEFLGDSFQQKDYVVDCTEVVPPSRRVSLQSFSSAELSDSPLSSPMSEDGKWDFMSTSPLPQGIYRSKLIEPCGINLCITPPAFVSMPQLSFLAEQRLEEWRYLSPKAKRETYQRLMECVRLAHTAIKATDVDSPTPIHSAIRQSITDVTGTIKRTATYLMEI